MLKHGILGLLNYTDLTGYEIMEVFRDSLKAFWNVQTSQIYRELQTLKDRGWVEVVTVVQNGKPDKNVFSINDNGRAELLEWLGTELNVPTRLPLLMKVFFLGERTAEENIIFFERLKQSSQRSYEVLKVADQTPIDYKAALNDDKRSQYWEMTNLYGTMHMQMIIKWCDACIKMIQENTK